MIFILLQVFPNGLSRRTTYRTHPKMAIPVAAPMSPVPPLPPQQQPPSAAEAEAASPVIAPAGHPTSSYLAASKPQPKIYESLKSQFRSEWERLIQSG